MILNTKLYYGTQNIITTIHWRFWFEVCDVLVMSFFYYLDIIDTVARYKKILRKYVN